MNESSTVTTRQRGFTIVELLIVIVVIAILTAISIISYVNMQREAQNSATTAAVAQYIRGLSLYHTQNNSYPGPVYESSTNTRYVTCVDGSSDCWSNINISRSTAVADQLKAVMGSLPSIPNGHAFTHSPADGYYVIFTQKGVSSCPIISGASPGTTTQTSGGVQCRARLPN